MEPLIRKENLDNTLTESERKKALASIQSSSHLFLKSQCIDIEASAKILVAGPYLQ